MSTSEAGFTASLPTDDLDDILARSKAFWQTYRDARIYVTGGTGFIGRWLVQTFQRANDVLGARIHVTVLTRSSADALQKWPAVFTRHDVSLVQGDVRTFEAKGLQFDLCIHAATDAHTVTRAPDPVAIFDSIAGGTRQTVQTALSGHARRILILSSGAVYGAQPAHLERIPETYPGAPDPLDPRAVYGNAKRAAEWLACGLASQAAPDTGLCIARIFALMGPGLPLDGNFAAGNFIRDALRGSAIQVAGDGRPVRSYLYMSDLCIWLLRLLQSGQSGCAYNVGSEMPCSIGHLAGTIAGAAEVPLPVHIGSPIDAGTLPHRYLPDTRKAKEELQLQEWTPLATAIQKTLRWSKSHVYP